MRLLVKLLVAAWLVDHDHTRIARWFYRRAGIPQTIPGRVIEGTCVVPGGCVIRPVEPLCRHVCHEGADHGRL